METTSLWQSSLVVFSVVFAARNVVEIALGSARRVRKSPAKRGRTTLVFLILSFAISGAAAFATLMAGGAISATFVSGLAVFLTAYAGRLVTLRRMGEHYSLFVDPCAPAIISDGPFRFVRHPLYALYMGEMAGIWLMAPNVISAGSLAVVAVVSVHRSLQEETALMEVFGDQYLVYRRKTKRFIPFIY